MKKIQSGKYIRPKATAYQMSKINIHEYPRDLMAHDRTRPCHVTLKEGRAHIPSG